MASSNVITIFRTDDLPDLFFQVLNKQTGNPIDSSASTDTAAFKFRSQGNTTTTLFTTALTKIAGGTTGIWQLTWPAASLDALTGGFFEGEITLTFNSNDHTVNSLILFLLKLDFA